MNEQHGSNYNKNKKRNALHHKSIHRQNKSTKTIELITDLFTQFYKTNDKPVEKPLHIQSQLEQKINQISDSLEHYLYHSNFKKERMDKIKIKTKYQDENYKLSFMDFHHLTFENLMKDLEKKYKFKSRLAYLDEENDLISIFTDEELQIALQHFQTTHTTPKFKINKLTNVV
eukprot:gene9303-1391_t